MTRYAAGAVGLVALASLTACSTTSGSAGDTSTSGSASSKSSFVYTQSNGAENEILVFSRSSKGGLKKVQEIATGGKGTAGQNAVTGEKSSPDALFSGGAVTTSADHSLVFAANAGDGSVSSFTVGSNGRLTLVNRVSAGAEGVVKSVSYDSGSGSLYVLHTFGPDPLTRLSVAADGTLSTTHEKYSLGAGDRVATQVVVSPDSRFVLVDVVFDKRPGADGTLTPSNDAHKNGLVVFPVKGDGSLGAASFQDAGGPAPFTLTFQNHSDTKFVNALVGSNGAAVLTLGDDGKVHAGNPTPVDLAEAPDGPSETCWIAFSPDNEYVYATNFSLGTISSYKLDGDKLTLLKGTAASEPSSDGFKSLAGIPTSGPGDSWVSSDGYLYQLYANADKIVGYRIEKDGALTRVTDAAVPHNSTTGLVGF